MTARLIILSDYIRHRTICRCLFLCIVLVNCKHQEDPVVTSPPVVTNKPVPVALTEIADTYASIADPVNSYKWGPYNVHDPSIIQVGTDFYSYSTDVAFGFSVRSGIQVRKSSDLVSWEFIGWVFSELPVQAAAFIKANGGTPYNALWAPYVIKVADKYRLYYSLSSSTLRLSVIGLAISDSPEGPWADQGLVVTSVTNGPLQTNAIDPTVIVDVSGNHYLYYGSAFDGIYILKLNAATGLPAAANDKGVRIAQRGFTGSTINGNIEAPEIIYHPDLNKYYLFISYDWLETKYNVRVGRSNSPMGPFLDYNGVDLNDVSDHGPMILAPYRFGNHSGWQGTGHCSVFRVGANRYYIATQGRPAENYFFMILHVRQIFWSDDGWPVVSPERYAAIENEPVTRDMIAGGWDRIAFDYKVVPGFSNEQKSADIQASSPISLDAGGTISNDPNSSWTFTYPKLVLNWGNGTTETLTVHRGRDWENKITSTFLFTGMNQKGASVWGRKVN